MTNDSRSRVRFEQGSKRVRAYLGGELVADTTRPLLVWEKPYYPVYYFPVDDVHSELLTASGETRRSPSRGNATLYTVVTAAAKAEGAAYRHLDSPIAELRNHIAFTWDAMDAWVEEDEQVYVHARNPYTRVDVSQRSSHGVPLQGRCRLLRRCRRWAAIREHRVVVSLPSRGELSYCRSAVLLQREGRRLRRRRAPGTPQDHFLLGSDRPTRPHRP